MLYYILLIERKRFRARFLIGRFFVSEFFYWRKWKILGRHFIVTRDRDVTFGKTSGTKSLSLSYVARV